MIDYIIFGEFDINEGNVIKLEYPEKTGVSDLILSSYMIPEGAHNTMSDTFTFVLNKKTNSDEILLNYMREINEKMNLNKIKYLDLKSSSFFSQIIEKHFFLKEIFNFNNYSKQWEPIKLENFSKENNTFLKIEKDSKENFHNFVIFNNKSNEVYFSIPIHSDIQFKKLKDNFASIYTLNCQAIGFYFENDTQLDLIEKLFENDSEIVTNRTDDSNYLLISNLQNVLNYEKEIYFLCNFVTKLDKSSKRGAILKSIAIGTNKLCNLLVFKSLLKFLIDEVFKIYAQNISNEDKFSSVKKLIEQSYKSFNSLKIQANVNSSTRGILSYLQFNNYIYLNPDQKTVDLNIKNQILKIDIAIPDNPEKIFQSSLLEFCNTFKENTMIIYDAILSDKKIMFIGDSSTQCEKLSRFIFSCVAMVSPPCVGMIKRIYPYGNLYDLSFLERENAIYGVTNPIFKSKTDWWDVMCEIDSGKVVLSEKYKKQYYLITKDSDNFFIKELLYKIKNDFLSEFEVSLYFRLYTTHILNITGEEYFADDEDLMNEINKQWQRKIKIQNSTLWKNEKELVKVKDNISHNGRSLKLIYNHIDNLYKRKFIEKEELLLIYSDIEKFIGNETLTNELIYILCTYTIDFQIFFNAFFSRHVEIVRIIKKIHKKIAESQFGSQMMRKLNLVFLLKINYLEIASEITGNQEK